MSDSVPTVYPAGCSQCWQLICRFAACTICGFDRNEVETFQTSEAAREKLAEWRKWKSFRGYTLTVETTVRVESAGAQSLSDITDGEE